MANVTDTVVAALVGFTCMGYILWHVLILIGYLKGPILRKFEKYGDDEPVYFPWPNILAAFAILSIFLGYAAWFVLRAWYLPFGPAILMLAAAWYTWDKRDVARRYPQVFQRYPRWLWTLREYTSRLERRRIAYQWLRLPRRTRLLLNSSDKAFLQWADMIVLSTMM